MKNIHKFGFYCALVAFIATVGFDVVQIMQVVYWLKFPWDGILIYAFSLCIPVPFILAMLALHYSVPDEKRIWTHAALLFLVIYAMYVCLNYVVQLAMVIPMSLQEKLAEIKILDQTPHSLFWNIDALGYIFMGLAALFASFALSGPGAGKWAKRLFLAHALVTPLITFVYFYPTFNYTLLLLGFPWAITAAGSMLALTFYFRARLQEMP